METIVVWDWLLFSNFAGRPRSRTRTITANLQNLPSNSDSVILSTQQIPVEPWQVKQMKRYEL